MIITRQLLSVFLQLKNIPNKKIVNYLTELGFETDIVENWSEENKGIKIAQVISFYNHTKLKSLRVVTIKNEEQKHTLICGATNFNVGDYVVWAPPGSVLTNNFKIKTRKFIDVLSQGMLCSYSEIGISEKNDNGIIIINSLHNKKIDQNNPLKYLGYDDTIFNIDVLPGNSEFQNVYALAWYLSRLWKIDFNIPTLPKKKLSNTKFKNLNNDSFSNQIKESLSFKVKKTIPPKWLINFRNHCQKKTANTYVLLLEFLETLYGVKLNFSFSTDSVQKISFFEKKVLINGNKPASFSENKTYAIIVAQNDRQSELPCADLYRLALQHCRMILETEFKVQEITIWKNTFSPRKNDVLTLDFSMIQKISGIPFTFPKLEKLLKPAQFNFKTLPNKQIEVTCPNHMKINHTHDFVEEVIRFYQISNLKEIPITYFPHAGNINFELKSLNKLRNYILNQGLKELKIPFEIPHLNTKNLENFKIKSILPQTLIPSLKKIAFDQNCFTFDTIFLNQNGQINENQFLSIVWKSPIFIDSFKKQKINPSRSYLIAFIKNIIHLLGISSKTLTQKHQTVVGEPDFSSTILPQQLFSKTGTDELWLQKSSFGKIGVINNFKQEQKNSIFYLEINITHLLKLCAQKKSVKFISQHQEQSVYRDFSIDYLKTLPNQVDLTLSDNKKIRYSFYDLLFQELKNLDPKIVKLEIIDIYQNKIITWRFWKILKTEEAQNKANLFTELASKLQNLKNVKIT